MLVGKRVRGTLMATAMATLVSAGATAQDQSGRTIEVPLAGGGFEIGSGFAGDLEERLAEAAKRRSELGGSENPAVPLVVVTSEPAETLPALVSLGLQPVERFAPDVYVVLITPENLEKLAEVPGVRGVDILPVEAKVADDARRATPFDWQRRDEGVAYSVQVYPGTAPAEIEALVEVGIVRDLENYDRDTVEIVRVFDVITDLEEVGTLAEVPFVSRVEPAPPPDLPDNLDGTQPLSNVDDVQTAPYDLSGKGIDIGVWEATEDASMGFGIRSSHESLVNRVTIEETSNASNHATHVAGTIASSGLTAGTEGMAPAAELAGYGADGDAGEMVTAKNSPGGTDDPLPIAVSNHSYGPSIGWTSRGTGFRSQAFFGQYTTRSAGVDNVVIGSDLVVVKSAGNHRNDRWNGTSTDSSIPSPRPPRDCRQGGLGVDADCLGPMAVAKNIITVGAMTPTGGVAGFSSFGPTDDGRIKPDLMANGTRVDSTGAGADDAVFESQGTSMSSPAVAGIAALLLEEAARQSLDLSAAAVKAILTQTARDVAGTGQATVGPDYATGWGIADARAAVDLIRRPAGAGVVQETLASAGTAGAYTQPFLVPPGEDELRVTIAWTDPVGSTTAPQNQPRLTNDLDLRLIDPAGTAVRPWALDPANPGRAAVPDGGDDTRNNVEQVFVDAPAAGLWQVRVTAKATSFLGAQDFALAGPFSPASGPGSGAVASDPADIMLVLDRSGSMNSPSGTPGISKLGALQSAAEELANFVEIVGGHRLGIVPFSSGAGSTAPAFDLQVLDSGSIGQVEDAIGNLSAGGTTNIIEGVAAAAGQLGGVASPGERQAVILFSDGRHNTPRGSDVADIDGVLEDDTRFYSIGFGTDVDSTVMPGVAANHDGVHLEDQSLSAAELSKLFLTVAGVAVDETIVVDPDYVIQPDGFASQPVVVEADDRNVTFAMHWNTLDPRQFSWQVEAPDKGCFVTGKGADGVQVRQGERYALIRIDLPFECPFSGVVSHEGEWRLNMRSDSEVTDTVKVMVLADSALEMKVETRVADRELEIVAWLERDGEPVVDGTRMRAVLTANRASTRDSDKQDARGSERAGERIVKDGIVLDRRGADIDRLLLRPDIARQVNPALLGRMARLRPVMAAGSFAPRNMIGRELRDDGRQGDDQAFDGRFTARVQLKEGGLYQTHVTAQLPSRFGPVTREVLTSVQVK